MDLVHECYMTHRLGKTSPRCPVDTRNVLSSYQELVVFTSRKRWWFPWNSCYCRWNYVQKKNERKKKNPAHPQRTIRCPALTLPCIINFKIFTEKLTQKHFWFNLGFLRYIYLTVNALWANVCTKIIGYVINYFWVTVWVICCDGLQLITQFFIHSQIV